MGNIFEVSSAQLKPLDACDLDWLVRDRLWYLRVNLEELPEGGIGTHIGPIDDILEIKMELLSSSLDVLCLFQRKVCLGG